VIEEYEDKSLADLAQKHSLLSHHYLSSSPHIAVLTDSATLIVDYKGVIAQKIEETGVCLSNWAEGFMIGGQHLRFFRF
jgi:transcriptional regulator of acetoin/glycerol metabolism